MEKFNVLLESYATKIDKIEYIFSKEITKGARDNILNNRDVNNKSFKKNEANTKNLFKTGKLFNSLTSKNNFIFFNKYGVFLNSGTKYMDKREFLPINNKTKQYKRILNSILKEILIK